MGTAAIRELVTRQRLALCDQLDTLTADQFEVTSLCHGWRVRDVLGHLVSIIELPLYRFAAFSPSGLERKIDTFAHRVGKRDPWELVNEYRTHADKMSRVHPAGTVAYLIDVGIHCLDISRPLDAYPALIPEAKPSILDGLAGGSWFTGVRMQIFRKRSASGLRLEATDVDWAHGDGPQVTGTADDLILALSGRNVNQARLTSLQGDGVARFLET